MSHPLAASPATTGTSLLSLCPICSGDKPENVTVDPHLWVQRGCMRRVLGDRAHAAENGWLLKVQLPVPPGFTLKASERVEPCASLVSPLTPKKIQTPGSFSMQSAPYLKPLPCGR